MASTQLWKVQIWQPWVIISFWLAQMSVVIIPIFELFFVLVLWIALPETRRLLSRYSYFELVSYVVSFILLVVEHFLYRRGKLRPLIYLISQTLKSVGPTFAIFRHIQFIRKYARFIGLRAAIIREIVYVLTFWGALAYAISAFVSSLRRRHRYRNMSIAEQMHDLFPATKGINTATKLRATSSNLFKLVSWLNADDPWSSTLPQPFRASLRWTIFFAKYIISAPLVIILFSVTRGLSGEPCESTTAEFLASWKYPTPSNLSPYNDIDTENSLRNGAALDEESVINAVGLDPLRHPERVQQAQGSIGRLLLPRFLCFITDAENDSAELSYTTREVDNGHNRTADFAYVFISYTRRQFYSQIPNDPSLSEAEIKRFKAAAERDKRSLIRFAIAAAKEAGVSAFWIDFECIRPEEESAHGEDIEEVYRICDIVRASHSMAILLGPALDEDKNHVDGTSKNDWLLGWGERLWTVPEALLCPSEHRIAIYSVDSSVPEKVAKRNLPGRVWDDAGMLRQLIDHYESSLHLTQLELISIALECLQRRQTETRNAGDVAYALMGLLRLRPSVHKTDTGFQAFARLSLANDSDMILERLLCLSKSSKTLPWHDMADTWDAKLWQIKPHFQIAGLESNNAVMIGSASGASIDWTSLYPVDFTRVGSQQRGRWKWARHITTYLLAWVGWYYVMQFIFVPVVTDLGYDYQRLGQAKVDYMVKIYGYCFLFLCSLTLSIPVILCQHYRSDLDTIQARFFGLEGRPSLGQVEKYLFGVNCGRLKWSTEETHAQGYADSRRLFTLIDTRSNTAMTFRADEPPSLIFVGAAEQGVIRALLCSYDLTHRTFVKETVVRLESAALQSMQLLERFRFSIDPTAENSGRNHARGSVDSDRISLPDVPEFICLDD